MNRIRITLYLTVLALASLACGIVDTNVNNNTNGDENMQLILQPIPPITLSGDLTQIDLCQLIPQENLEAVMGSELVNAPERIFDYDGMPGESGCAYVAASDADGSANFGYVVLTPIEAYENQPLYLEADVSGLGQEAYFNNGAAARELWVKANDDTAFVVAFGDVPKEAGAQALAHLLVSAIDSGN